MDVRSEPYASRYKSRVLDMRAQLLLHSDKGAVFFAIDLRTSVERLVKELPGMNRFLNSMATAGNTVYCTIVLIECTSLVSVCRSS